MYAKCQGRPVSEAMDMLAQYHSGFVKLPKRLRDQIEKVEEKDSSVMLAMLLVSR